MQNKQANRLKGAYRKRMNKLNKDIFKDNKNGLILFVEHLKYLRDTFIVKSDVDITTNNSLATLMIAIDEFGAYQTCEDTKQKDFHWKNFCEFLKLNMEEWLVLNDPI